ncbi:hypothetical protein, partial [Stutzerimonas nitrititolerans]|uniref:hypothetical protein n=1 Tax=Stutzerimonas nitrititolerans TaxID=2482751 RepID=UPI0028B19FEC
AGGKCFAVFHGAAYRTTAIPTLAAKPDVGWTTQSLSTSDIELTSGKGFAVFHATVTPTLATKPDVGWTTRSLSTFANTELSGGKGVAVFHPTIACEPRL